MDTKKKLELLDRLIERFNQVQIREKRTKDDLRSAEQEFERHENSGIEVLRSVFPEEGKSEQFGRRASIPIKHKTTRQDIEHLHRRISAKMALLTSFRDLIELGIDTRPIKESSQQEPEGPKEFSDEMSGVRVFVSHSSSDKEVATAIVELIEAAFDAKPNEIRCTSVPGYKLPIGSYTSDKLRGEIQAADLLIGLITPNSVKSGYVLFELGAAWGFQKECFACLALGASPGSIPGPLRERHAVRLTNAEECHQLLEELARVTDMTRLAVSGARISAKISSLVKAAESSLTVGR